jgi:acetyl-CoA carboxylase carboxyltransferase component
VSGTVEWQQTGRVTEVPKSFVPSNNIQGMGTLRGRRVVMTADDFTIRSGHADGASSAKTVFLEKMAIAMKLPIVKLVDGSSGGGSVTTIKTAGWSYIPLVQLFHQVNQQLNMGIPNLGAVLGPAVSSILATSLRMPFESLISLNADKDRLGSSTSSGMPLLRDGS